MFKLYSKYLQSAYHTSAKVFACTVENIWIYAANCLLKSTISSLDAGEVELF